jgi:hypothetical protein
MLRPATTLENDVVHLLQLQLRWVSIPGIVPRPCTATFRLNCVSAPVTRMVFSSDR